MGDSLGNLPSAIQAAVKPAEGYGGDIDEATSFALLQQSEAAVLIDVRTRAEWAFVGQPDLSSLGKPLLSVEWVEFPTMSPNGDFVNTLTSMLNDLGADQNAPLVFMCRSGQRSIAAAKAMTAQGYTSCFNMLGGFEGDKNEQSHRGNVNGWKVAGLPWKQG